MIYIYCTEIFPLVYFNDLSSVLTSFILKALSYMHLVIIIARFCRKIECCSYSLKTTSVFWHRTVASFCSRHLWYELQRVNFHYLVLFFFKREVRLVRFTYICILYNENTMCYIVQFGFIFYLSVDICFAFIFRKKNVICSLSVDALFITLDLNLRKYLFSALITYS